MHAVGVHVPVVCAPAHEKAVGQSAATSQGVFEQLPRDAPTQVAPTAQSVFDLQVVARAAADTWKSLNTTRPHCDAGAAFTGVLNVIARSMSGESVWLLFLSQPYIQRWLRRAACASWRGSVMFIWPSAVVAPMFCSHCANAAPFGKVVSMSDAVGSA
jgi:hypothetical protein